MSKSVKGINEIIAEETADVHVYEIRYFGAPYGLYGELGPDQYDLDDVRALAEDTLHPGQELYAYEHGLAVAHYKADPVGHVWEVEL